MKDGGLIYESNINGHRIAKIVASDLLQPGSTQLGVQFEPDGPPADGRSTPAFAAGSPVPGTITLLVNGKKVGSGHIEGIGNNTDTFDIGYDRGSPVSASYASPFAFTGKVEEVKIDLK